MANREPAAAQPAPSVGESPNETDAALVQAAQADPLQFEGLYGRYFEQVYRYVARRVLGKSNIDYLVSTVFLNALQGLPKYRGGQPFNVWLFAIAHNLVADYYRKSHPTSSLALAENLSGDGRLADRD